MSMKPKSIAVTAILLYAAMILGATGHALAETQAEIRITTNSYEDSFPDVKGDYVVWQAKADTDWEIFIYNLATGQGPVQITNNNYGDVMPKTDGTHVAWLGNLPSGSEIFVYNISTGQTTQVTADSNIDSFPEISGGLVAWTTSAVTTSVEPSDICIYDIAAGATSLPSVIVDPGRTLEDDSPRFSGGSLVWLQEEPSPEGGNMFFRYEPQTGACYQVSEDDMQWENSPDADGNVTALTRHDGNDFEVFVRDDTCPWPDTCLDKLTRISRNTAADRNARISGRYIVWESGTGSGSEIFFAVYEPTSVIQANVEIYPDTLNPKSQGQAVTAYIELTSHDVERIDPSKARMRLDNAVLFPLLSVAPRVGDYDQDGAADLMITFDRQALLRAVAEGTVEIMVTGASLLAGGQRFYFQGSDTMRVMGYGSTGGASKQ